jgi:hypothetical protein
MQPTTKRLNPDAAYKKKKTVKPKALPQMSDEEFVPRNQEPTGLYRDFLNKLSEQQRKP